MAHGERAPGSVRVLVADDQADVRAALSMLLRSEGYETVEVASPDAVLEALRRAHFDALLLDMNYTRDTTSGREGLRLLEELTALDAALPIVVMTAWGSVEGAVEAMRRGARDYVEKPWDNRRLITILAAQLALASATRASARLADAAGRARAAGLPELVADSPAMQPVLRLVEDVAPSDANVLITGEHGTGKEVVARWLHHLSRRKDAPFVAVNAGAFADNLLESELFGHVRGAFTDAHQDRAGCFELADGGTLFLDEIATMPAAQQARLLRVLENGEVRRVGSERVLEVDVRVLAATNADLAEACASGAFRSDLLYRLNTVEVHLPPLRERREDIAGLAARFLAERAAHYGRPLGEFTEDALGALDRHPWPGNVRELQHAVERGVLLARGPRIAAADLGLEGRHPPASDVDLPSDLTIEAAERLLIERALARHRGNVSRAALDLGLSRSSLYRRLQRHGLDG